MSLPPEVVVLIQSVLAWLKGREQHLSNNSDSLQRPAHLGGNIIPVENLAEILLVDFDAGAKRILLPMASVKDIPTIPGDLFATFQTGVYVGPVEAVFKALGVQ